jgi:hypothetical protein
MPKGIPNPKPPVVETDDEILARMIAEEEAAKPKPFGGKGDHDGDGKVGGAAPALSPKMVAMVLLRNYRPAGVFEVVGHMQPAIIRKDAAGREFEAQKAQFIAGEGMPSPQAGVGTSGKIWAGTIVRVPQDEARIMRTNGIAERSVDD